MAYTRLDSKLESTEFFSQILCPLMLRTDPSSSWLFYKITPNIKLNHQAPINCWFYFIFGVFVYKMAIIHLESSRKLTNLRTNSFVRTIGVIPISAILNYRRHLHKMAHTRLDLIMKSWECLLENSPEIIESAITNYRRYSTIGVTQLSASLTKDGVYSLGLNPGFDRIFLANFLPINAPYGSFKLLIIL